MVHPPVLFFLYPDCTLVGGVARYANIAVLSLLLSVRNALLMSEFFPFDRWLAGPFQVDAPEAFAKSITARRSACPADLAQNFYSNGAVVSRKLAEGDAAFLLSRSCNYSSCVGNPCDDLGEVLDEPSDDLATKNKLRHHHCLPEQGIQSILAGVSDSVRLSGTQGRGGWFLVLFRSGFCPVCSRPPDVPAVTIILCFRVTLRSVL
ncbi:hypothetical protein Tco_0774193 [Tanacetum coccineum]|uniref:Uncharacterized protein n=1 Tax=Tanacetum coccineum TaxID=301880 RepID=A0ABQ4ZRJ0_9ASTR